ncbi:MAG: hypothetical protein GY790_11100 [Bacteroidetes bacterium]|nr:hypothetical protein [Bacteroidota bacterium]
MLTRQTILQINSVYTANAFVSGSRTLVGAGSETEPMVQLYDLASGTVETLEQCPGGMMSLIPVPGRPQNLVSVMGLFPPFIGKEAALFLHQKEGGVWKSLRAMDLPFAHRCEFLPHPERTILIAASVSSFKENPSDWSRPGELYAISLEGDLSNRWAPELIDRSITRNHGMGRYWIDGIEHLCVSGDGGVFSIELSPDGSLKLDPLFKKEVSEMTFIDLDGDGQSELVTIEPFHGNVLNIYKRVEGAWKLKFSGPLSFGHGLSSGMFNGSPVVIVGNRRDSQILEMVTVNNLDKGSVNRVVIEEEAGPTQTQVFSFGNRDYILSANQRKNEVALYSGTQ